MTRIPPDRDPELRRLISLDAAAQTAALARMAGETQAMSRSAQPQRARTSRMDLPVRNRAAQLPANVVLTVVLDGIDTYLWCGVRPPSHVSSGSDCLFTVGGSMAIDPGSCEALFHAAKAIVNAFEREARRKKKFPPRGLGMATPRRCATARKAARDGR